MQLANLPNQLIDALNVIGIEPLRANAFAVEIGGEPLVRHLVGGFSEVDGLSLRGEVLTIEEGGFDGVHEFPVRDKCQPVTLRRPMTTSRYFSDWWQQVINWEKGQPTYVKDVTIHQLYWQNGIPVEARSWTLHKAWPSDWSISPFNALGNDISSETIVLHHRGLLENQSLLGGVAGEIIGVLAG